MSIRHRKMMLSMISLLPASIPSPCPIPSNPIPSHPIPTYPIQTYPSILSYPISLSHPSIPPPILSTPEFRNIYPTPPPKSLKHHPPTKTTIQKNNPTQAKRKTPPSPKNQILRPTIQSHPPKRPKKKNPSLTPKPPPAKTQPLIAMPATAHRRRGAPFWFWCWFLGARDGWPFEGLGAAWW